MLIIIKKCENELQPLLNEVKTHDLKYAYLNGRI